MNLSVTAAARGKASPLYNLSVCFADSSPSRGASGEEAKLCGMPRPPLARGGGTASAVTERLSPTKASRPGCPSSNLSVSLRSTRPGCGSQRLLRCRLHPAGRCPNSDSLFPPLAAVVAVAPDRGASGEEARLCGMPRPPLVRSNGDDRRQRRKQGGAVGAAASRMQATAKQTLGAATRAVASRSDDGEVLSRSGSRSGCPSYNLSVSSQAPRQLP